MLPALPIGYVIMGLLWPWSVLSPLNPLRAAEYFDTFFEKPWKELYDGVPVAVPDMPATYLPHLFALKLPVVMLALVLIGTAGALIAIARGTVPLPKRANLLLFVLAAFLPIVLAMITRPALYNGVRHFIFVVPPMAVLGGLAAAWVIERATAYGRIGVTALAAVLAAGLAVPVIGMVRLHPYEYVYFNALAGGVRGAQSRYMLDYWGLAFKQAAEALRAHLAAAHAQPPAGRRWVVAICGSEPAARVPLGGDFNDQLGPQHAPIFSWRWAIFIARAWTLRCSPKCAATAWCLRESTTCAGAQRANRRRVSGVSTNSRYRARARPVPCRSSHSAAATCRACISPARSGPMSPAWHPAAGSTLHFARARECRDSRAG